jgi:DHA1 family tetracycline resistance protein-like MFS transporter
MRKEIIPIALLNFVNVLGFTIMIPVMPYIIKYFNQSPVIYGFLLSIYPFFQFLSSPILGSLSDKYGRKPVLLISQIGTVIGWLVFALSYYVENIPLMFTSLPIIIIAFARMIDGVTGGNSSIANAYLSDITSPQEKAKLFGTIGAISGIGMLIGPAIGSFSSSTSIGYLGTIIVVGFISVLTLVFIQFYLKESLPDESKNKDLKIDLFKNLNLIYKISKYKENTVLMNLFILRVFFGFVMSCYTSIIMLFVIDTFNLEPKQLGYFLLFVGSFLIFNQAVMVKQFIRKFGDIKTLIIAQFLLMFGLVSITTTSSMALYIVFYYILNLGISLSMPSFKSMISNSVDRTKQGEIMGIEESMAAATSALGPMIAGWFYTHIHSQAFILIAGLVLISLLIVYIKNGSLISALKIKHSPNS